MQSHWHWPLRWLPLADWGLILFRKWAKHHEGGYKKKKKKKKKEKGIPRSYFFKENLMYIHHGRLCVCVCVCVLGRWPRSPLLTRAEKRNLGGKQQNMCESPLDWCLWMYMCISQICISADRFVFNGSTSAWLAHPPVRSGITIGTSS